MSERQLLVTLLSLFPPSVLTGTRCTDAATGLPDEFGDAFLGGGKENTPAQIQTVVFSALAPENAMGCSVNMYINRLSLTAQRKAACAQRPRWRTPRFRTCSRADSARAPNPLEP